MLKSESHTGNKAEKNCPCRVVKNKMSSVLFGMIVVYSLE